MESKLLDQDTILSLLGINPATLSFQKKLQMVLVLSKTAKTIADIIKQSDQAMYPQQLQDDFGLSPTNSIDTFKYIQATLCLEL